MVFFLGDGHDRARSTSGVEGGDGWDGVDGGDGGGGGDGDNGGNSNSGNGGSDLPPATVTPVSVTGILIEVWNENRWLLNLMNVLV